MKHFAQISKNYLIGLVVILIGSNIVTSITLKQCRNHTASLIKVIHNNDSLNQKAIEDIITLNFRQEIYTNKLKESIRDNNQFLIELLRGKDKVILYFDENSCNTCVLSILMDFNMLSNIIGVDKLIIAGQFANHEGLYNYLGNFNSSIERIITSPLPIPMDDINGPVLFILDKNQEMKLIFYPERYPELRKAYFNTYLPEYFSLN